MNYVDPFFLIITDLWTEEGCNNYFIIVYQFHFIQLTLTTLRSIKSGLMNLKSSNISRGRRAAP